MRPSQTWGGMVGWTTADQGNVRKWRVIVGLTGSDGTVPVARGRRGRQQHSRVLGRDGWGDAGGRQTDARGIAGTSRSRIDRGILPYCWGGRPHGVACQNWDCEPPRPEPSMTQYKRIGIDTSKAVFTLHRVGA
jgi:hypothetical protein